MKTYKASDLTHKRAEVMREAELNGVLIEERRSNGEVINRFIIRKYSAWDLYDRELSLTDPDKEKNDLDEHINTKYSKQFKENYKEYKSDTKALDELGVAFEELALKTDKFIECPITEEQEKILTIKGEEEKGCSFMDEIRPK